MKRAVGGLVGSAVLATVTACSSTTMILSQPTGARLFLNGEPVGQTPYTMTDTKIVGSTTTVRLELPGYETTTGSISRNEEFEVGACIGGVLLLFPFLWIEGYKPTHAFELKPVGWAGPPPGAYPPGYGPPPAGYPPPPGFYPPGAPGTYPPQPAQGGVPPAPAPAGAPASKPAPASPAPAPTKSPAPVKAAPAAPSHP